MDEIDKTFLGKGWSFPPSFHQESGGLAVKMVAEEEDIAESLRILLSTRPGERVMHPSFGCGLQGMVFDVINESAVTEIKDLVERAILFFEPRITLDEINVNTDDELEGRLKLLLNYRVRKTNTRGNVVYPFYYLEGSQVRI